MENIDFKTIQKLPFCKVYAVNTPENFAKTLATVKLITDSSQQDSSTRFIYITSKSSSAHYIRENCKDRDGMKFELFNSPTTSEIISLIEHRTNIISDTNFLKNLNPKCMGLIYKYDYILILDSNSMFFEPCQITKDDANILLSRYAYVKENGDVHWRKSNSDYNGVFTEYKNYCDLNCLRTYDKEFFIWSVPSTVFQVFKQAYVLTDTPEAKAHFLYYKCLGINPITATITGMFPSYAVTTTRSAPGTTI